MLEVRWFSLCFSRLGDFKREISAKRTFSLFKSKYENKALCQLVFVCF